MLVTVVDTSGMTMSVVMVLAVAESRNSGGDGGSSG